MGRYPLKYSLRQFVKPDITKILKDDPVDGEDKDSDDNDDTDSNGYKLCDRLVRQLKKLKKEALDEDEYCLAGNINNMLKRIAQSRAENKPYCGYSSPTEIHNMLRQLESEKEKQERKRKAQVDAEVALL